MAKGNDRSARDKERAAYLKKIGEERTTGICPVCYSHITIDHPGKGTKYRHVCGLRAD